MSEQTIATLSEIEAMPEFQDGRLSSFIGQKPKLYQMPMEDINRQFSVDAETIKTWSERPEDDWFTRQGKGVAAGLGRTYQSAVDLFQKGNNYLLRHTFPSANEDQARRLIELGMRQSTNRQMYRASHERYEGTDDSMAAEISAAFGSALEYVGVGLLGSAAGGPGGAIAAIGTLSGIQTTIEKGEEFAQKYIEETGDYSLKNYDLSNDAIAAGYGAISGFIESSLGIESVLAGGFKNLGIKPVMRKLALGAIEEGSEEFLQESLGAVAGAIAGAEDRSVDEVLVDSLKSATYGALVGGTLGGNMYMFHRRRLAKRLSETYGLDPDVAKNLATNIIDDAASQTEKEASTVVALQDHFGGAFDSLVGKVESALNAAGWQSTQIDPKTNQPYDIHEYAKATATDIAFQVLRQAKINKVPVSDVLDLAEIESIDNVLYLRPQNLGTKAEIQNTIKEKKAEKKRLTDLAKTGAGDPARKSQLNTQIAVLQNLLDRINYKEQAQQQARSQELKDRSNLAKQDVKTLKKSKDVMDFYNKIPEANRQGLTLPNGQPDMLAVKRRHNDSKLMWLCKGNTNLFESLTEIGSTGTKVISGINNVIDNVYQFAKDNPDIDFRSDIKGALERLVQIANKPNFAEFVSNPSTTDIFGQNALLYVFNFGSTEDITTFLNNFMDKANTNKQDGKFESGTFDKNDLYSQCLKMFDSAFDGDVATDPNMRAVMLSKESEKSTPETLFQGTKKQGAYDPELQVIIIGRDFNTGTLPHEMAHFWLDDIFKRARTYNDWTPEFVEQANNLFAILGVEENQTSLTVEQQEKFARMVENVVFGLQKAPDGAELPTLAYLNWVPEKYKSVIDIRYKGQDGAFHYPLLDKQSADFFNAWYSNSGLPGLGSSPLDIQNENFTDKNGETVPSTPEIMKLRENDQQKAVNDQTKVDDEMHNIGMQNTATDTQAAITGYNTDVARNITTPEPVVEPQQKKKSFLRIGRGTNTRAEMIEEAQKYIEKNKEHAEEIAFGDPELVENDSGIERGILIRQVMNNYNKGSQEYSTLYDNLARTMSLAGKTGGLNNDIQVRYYLDGYSRLNRAMEAKAAAKYAGSNRGAITKFNQDIQKFIQSKADAILATEPGSKERNNLIDSMIREAEIKFAGGTGDARMLFQENNLGQKVRRQNKADFLKWADKEIKKMLKANPESDPQAMSKLITLSEKAQVARTQLDSTDIKEKVSAAQILREWQAYTDSLDDTVLDNQISKFNRGFRKIVGSWQPFAMLTNLNTHASNLASNTVNLGLVQSSLFVQYGKSKVDSKLIKAESERIWAIYNSTQLDISQMVNPATPSLLHGEKIDVAKNKFLQNLDTRMWLGREDLLFRAKVYLSTLAHIATKNAKASGKTANELFQEYCKLNQEAGSEGEQARQQAVLMGNIATFTQNGKLSGMLQKVRTEINKLTDPTGKAGFGTMLAPFLKTPANIVELGVRATIAPITDIIKLYKMAKGTSVWGIQDTLNNFYFVAALVAAALLKDYEPEYESGKKYDPTKPYDSINFGGKAWFKLDLFGAMETPIRFLAALKTNKGLGISGVVGATPLVGDVAESVSNVERASGSGEKLLSFGANYVYNQANKSVPAIIKQTMNLANVSDFNLEQIDLGIKTGIGRKIGRQYGLDAQERTDVELANDVLAVFFNRLKIKE